jgi:predicted DNA-binding transcriptional regulator AlpA
MTVCGIDPPLEALCTEKQVSNWLGISVPSLQRMRSNGCGPAFVQLSARRIGYRKSAIETWLLSRTVNRIGEFIVRPQTFDAQIGKGKVSRAGMRHDTR